MMRGFLISLILLVLPLAAFAQAKTCASLSGVTVFMDFNDAPEEIEAARAAATERCQEFKLVKSKAEAKKVFGALERMKQGIDTLILSGHSGEKGFGVTNFKMNAEELVAFIDSHPNVKHKTRDLYLWGCYTANVEKLEHWLGTFDNLDYVFGYNMLSPLSRQMTGADFLNRAMQYRDELRSKKSLEEIKDLIDNRILPGRPGFHYVNAAIYGKQQCDASGKTKEFLFNVDQVPGGTNTRIDDYTEFKANCGPALKQFGDEYQSTLKDYWWGNKEIPPMEHPDAKDPAKNPVRKVIYPWANRLAHCFKAGFQVDTGNWVGVGQILNLVFFHTIQRNFFNFFKDDIDKLKTLLARQDGTKDALDLLDGAPELTREQTLKMVGGLEKAIGQDQVMKSMSAQEREFAQGMVHRFKKYLRDLDSRCADIEWIEDKKTFARPSNFCMKP